MTDTPIILDGGMGRELEKMGAPFRQPEWSALALIETPDLVLQAHRNFIKAGAQVITTNAYAVVPFHIGQERFDARGREWIALSAKLALQAADEADRPVRVAGCLPPLFGSYKPENFDAQAAPPLLDAFIEEQAPYVDLWLAETLSAGDEVRAVRDAFTRWEREKPLWISYCLAQDSADHLRSGISVTDIVRFTMDETHAQAVLFNCCGVEDVEIAVKATKAMLDKSGRDMMVGAYPNAFAKTPQPMEANKHINPLRDEVTPEYFAEYAQKYIDAGASIVGGCCGITPAHIDALSELLSQ